MVSKRLARNIIPAKQKDRAEASLSVIILAAGSSTKMRSVGIRSLLPVNKNETLIENQIGIIRHFSPKAEIVVVIGFEADRMIASLSKPIKLVENVAYEETNSLRSLVCGLMVTTHDNILIVRGDLLFSENCVRQIVGNESATIVEDCGQIKKDKVGVSTNGDSLTHFSFGLKAKWGQLIFLRGNELDMLERITRNKANTKLCDFEAYNQILESGGQIRACFSVYNTLCEIDSVKDLKEIYSG